MKYSPKNETIMQQYYSTINERDRRRYAALEVLKLGYGGKTYIMKLFSCSNHTIDRGIAEVESNDNLTSIRKAGGGRKKKVDSMPELNDAFLNILKHNTAGSPMDETIKWTNLTKSQISYLLHKEGFNVGVKIVGQLLKKNDFKKRKPFKSIAGGCNASRDEQFKNIESLIALYKINDNPIISMDVKKKK